MSIFQRENMIFDARKYLKSRKKRCAASVSPRIVLGEGRAFVSLNFIIFDVRLYPRGGAKRRRVCVRVCVWVCGGNPPWT